MQHQTFLLCLCSFLSVCILLAGGQQLPFDITVRGSFRHDAGGTNCDYCDCGSTCTWVDNFTCTSPSSFSVYGADDNQQRWGTCSSNCNCFPNSGVGFQGVSDVRVYSNLADNNITRIGRISHYNNVINNGSPSRLRLTLTITAPQLAQPFIISYPLLFIETDNSFFSQPFEGCDPGIQRTNTSCDDRFSFESLTAADSFVVNNVKYTLEVVGFLYNLTEIDKPIKDFVTRERTVSRADVYGRIITFCQETECPANQVFTPPPICGCICALTDQTCQEALSPDWIKDPNSCNCICARNSSTACAPSNQTLNTDTCGCNCNITDAYCSAINPTWGVALAPLCACECKKQKFIDCYQQNPFYVPDIHKGCACVCEISDSACADRFGSGYTADTVNCLCIPPGGDGLSGGEIAGIVIGSTAGALLILLLMALLAGLLVWLIRSGKIPGIYGYRIDAADLSGAQDSPFYKDVWSHTASPMAD